MNGLSVLLLALIALWGILALRAVLRPCGGCHGTGDCSHCKKH